MRIKKVAAPTVAEAMARVRAELGPDAVILNSSVRPGGVEVTAARGEVAAAPEHRPEAGRRAQNPAAVGPAHGPARPAAGDADRSPAPVLAVETIVGRLVAHGVEEVLARALGASLADRHGNQVSPDLAPSALAEVLEGEAGRPRPVGLEARPTVVLVAGPSGSGKTTLVAKLAAQFSLLQGASVSLVNADSVRAGAAAQLEAFAGILDLPLYHAATAGELDAAMSQAGAADLVLVDSPGANPGNLMHLAQLRGLAESLAPHRVLLCLPATTGVAEAAHTVSRFQPLGVTDLVPTRVDEAAYRGNLINLSARVAVPFSYWSLGPHVPEDLAVFSWEKLVRWCLRETAWPAAAPATGAQEAGSREVQGVAGR